MTHPKDPILTLVEIKDLRKEYPLSGSFAASAKETVKALNGVALTIGKGEVLGLVGESGCGKSTLARLILGLEKPTSGHIGLEEALRDRRHSMQIIFQDPYASLNPRMKVGKIIQEPLTIRKWGTPEKRRQRVLELMTEVGLGSEAFDRYPHEFSGGQRQRIGIARALALNPYLIIADEPVSALDVSIQAQILNLLADLKNRFALTLLFISHDLLVVEYLCDRVAVLYAGMIMEIMERKEFHGLLKHPYTEALFAAVPVPDPRIAKKPVRISGDHPSPIHPPDGCPFHPRCPYRQEICFKINPPIEEKSPGHWMACHLR
jgi:oligopeptide/dipeptide ABC transporter ATP-binding protein